jgi:hypothetical protein
MMLSLYVTLGIFLLLAARNPSANRSLIALTAWSSFAHAAVMGIQAFRNLIPRGELRGVAALIVIGVALITLAPAEALSRASVGNRGIGRALRWRDRMNLLGGQFPIPAASQCSQLSQQHRWWLPFGDERIHSQRGTLRNVELP